MTSVKGRPLHSSRGSRKVFAKKARTNSLTLSRNFVERGGGYL